MLDASVGSGRLLIRLLTPSTGREAAQGALDSARAEIARVAAVPSGPELEAAEAAARRTARALGSRAPIDAAELRQAYAIDRAVARLLDAGMGDFLVDGGDVVRAQGSQDATLGRGWHVAVFGPDGDVRGTARLRDQSLARRAGASPACTTVAASAVLALGSRAALEATGLAPEGPRDLGLRVERADGGVDQNPVFQALLNPVGAAY